MGYGKVLLTLDGSTLAELALKHVSQVASAGAYIHLLSVTADDRVTEIAALASAIAQPVVLSDEQWPPAASSADPQVIHNRQDYLNRIASWLGDHGFHVSVDVRPGAVVETIVEVAREGYDLIVMATHGRTGLSRVALGSVAEGVLRKAPCPVLIIPARAAKAE